MVTADPASQWKLRYDFLCFLVPFAAVRMRPTSALSFFVTSRRRQKPVAITTIACSPWFCGFFKCKRLTMARDPCCVVAGGPWPVARALATARVLRSLFVYVSAQGMFLCVEMASLAWTTAFTQEAPMIVLMVPLR